MSSKLAVLVAAYNAEHTVRQAVESVLSGTQPCDVLVVDDASRIPVSDLLDADARVQIVRQKRNRGPAVARNVGLSKILAQDYDYVAIMDADDLSAPERLAKQVAFLDSHPRIGAVGTGARYFDEDTGTTVLFSQWPETAGEIRNKMFFNIGLFHPTAMIRADVLKAVGLYSEKYPAAEDYDLMRRIARKYDLANLPEYLLSYRVSSQGQSLRRRRRQLLDRLRIQLRYFAPLNWRAFAGVAQTLASLIIPMKLLNAVKLKVLRRQIVTPAARPSSS